MGKFSEIQKKNSYFIKVSGDVILKIKALDDSEMK